MFDHLNSMFNEIARQFPVVAITLLLAWFFVRYITKQHERELTAKNEEIARILQEKQKEIDRLLEERRKYFQLFLKELQAERKNPSSPGDEPKPPAPR